MTSLQLPLEPTAIEEALEEAVATGAEPEFFMGWQRDDAHKDRKKYPAPYIARLGMERFEQKCGVVPDTIWCCKENVELLTHFPNVRVRYAARIWHPDVFDLGKTGLKECRR